MNPLANQESDRASSSDTPMPPKPSAPGKQAPKPPPAPLKKGGASSGSGISGGGQKGLRVSLIPPEDGAGVIDLRKRVLMLIFAIVIEVLVIGGAYVYVVQISAQQETAFEGLQRRSQVVAAVIDEKREAAKDMADFDTRARAVEALLKTHTTWIPFFDIIESRTKPNVKYQNFVGDSDSGIVSLSATGKTFRDVAEQIVAFREHPQVISVQTNSAAARTNGLGEVVGVTFSMIVTMDLDAWRSEPLRSRTQ